MLVIQLNSITGATPPYDLYLCDVYGNQCAVLATINTPIPPSITLNVPSQFNNVPAIGLKIIDVNGCEQFGIINCEAIIPTPTPTMATPTPTPTMVTPTPTPTMVTPTPTPTPTTTPTQTLTPTPTTTPTQTPTPTQTLTPTPTPLPSLPGIYYGKFSNTTITSADTGSLTFVTTNDITNTYVTFSTGTGYGYVLIPITLPQPSDFKDSSTGCTGNDVPTNNIGTVVVLDANGFAITYNIYRTFYSFNGQLLCWLCS